MSYSCKILLDSISETNKRLTTFELTYPRIIHSEFMTHRMFSRNAASSRAIPFSKMLEMVETNPFIPEKFPINGKGMQPNKYIQQKDIGYDLIKSNWLVARDATLVSAKCLYNSLSDIDFYTDAYNEKIHVHKQIVNRLLEPFLWYTCLVTATEFSNFFKLRCDENAQYEIRRIADLMYKAYHLNDGTTFPIDYKIGGMKKLKTGEAIYVSRMQKLKVGEWHCPLVSEEDDEAILDYLRQSHYSFKLDNLKKRELAVYGLTNYYLEIKKKISVARCARVSYLTHDGKRDIEKDLELFEKLRTSGHYSPFEHVATPSFDCTENYGDKEVMHKKEDGTLESKWDLRNGNFIGWRQFRQDLPNENCINFRK